MKTRTLSSILVLSAALVACNRDALSVSPQPTQALTASCAFDAPAAEAKVALVAAVGLTVQAVYSDGSVHTIYDFSTDGALVQDGLGAGLGSTAGGFVLASAVLPPDEIGARASLVLLDLRADPKVVWSQVQRDQAAILGPDGTVYSYAFANATASTQAIALDGSVEQVPGLPNRVVSAGVLLAIEGSSELGSTFGWWRSGQAALQPLDPPVLGFDPPMSATGSAIAYLATQGTGTVAVVASPDGHKLAMVPGQAGGNYALSGQGRYLLITGYEADEGKRWRLDTTTGVIDPIVATFPAGMSDAKINEVNELSADGELLVGLRNDHLGGLYAGKDADWTRISLSFTDVQGVSIFHRGGGSYAVSTGDGAYVPAPWSAAPADDQPELQGPGTQLVRPASGVHTAISIAPGADVALTSDGICAAYFDAAHGGALTVTSLQDGSVHAPASALVGTSTGIPLWIER